MTWRVIVGTISLVVTMIALGFVAVTEQDRMASFTEAYHARSIEVGATLYESNCKFCHGDQGQGIESVAPALNAADLLAPDAPRLQQFGWTGTTEDYVRSAIAGGRPRPSEAYANAPNRMPTWGEEFGGPLRKDQVDGLVAFIMNWAPEYAGAAPQPGPAIVGVGTDITVELPAGDAANGESVAKAKGCVACHIPGGVGPGWLASEDPNGEGIGTRGARRIAEAGYAGQATSAEQYLFESIVAPNAYLVEGFTPGIMPGTYGNSLAKQDVADLLAYMLTLK